MDARPNRYLVLDGLRGLAAIAVVAHHGEGLFANFFPNAYLAVDFFFILSGFVISCAYEERLSHSFGKARFIVVRWIRLFPMWTVGIAAGALFQLATHEYISRTNLAPITFLNLLFLPNLWKHISIEAFPLNVPGWSLFCELVINIAYVMFLRKLRSTHLVCISVVAFAAFAFFAASNGTASLGAHGDTLFAGLLRAAYGFPLGVVLYRCHKQVPHIRMTWVANFIAIGVLLWLPVPKDFSVPYALVCIAVFLPAVVLLASDSSAGTRVTFLAVLGDISYPLYAVHFPFVRLIVRIAKKFSLPYWVADIGLIAILGVLVLILTYYCDSQARRWLTDRYDGWRKSLRSETRRTRAF